MRFLCVMFYAHVTVTLQSEGNDVHSHQIQANVSVSRCVSCLNDTAVRLLSPVVLVFICAQIFQASVGDVLSLEMMNTERCVHHVDGHKLQLLL